MVLIQGDMRLKKNSAPLFIMTKMWSNWPSITDLHLVFNSIIAHFVEVTECKILMPFVQFISYLPQIEDTPSTHTHISNSNLLDQYKYLPIPINFNFAANISITPDIGTTNLFAIRHYKSFQMISSSDLHFIYTWGHSGVT